MTRCINCDRAIFDGDAGLFHQEVVTVDMGDGTTLGFMDRIVDCDAGGPHVAPEGAEVEGG